ncbi:hypothetical protein DPEC_G00178910 [Dallia pectoralis]|uniref:Uncharacterized protein n=1 Tax=Dallia pectoralis TaxID=75939 RepID=A0ACC2GFS4_DALPE|nr:hypothetical protein DPEC_G00178910 [Dallia pectoralis]
MSVSLTLVPLLSSGFTAVTHVSARIFFVLFHIVVVIIIINIFIAFVLEAFFVEYTVDKSNLQSCLEKKIEELKLGVKQDHLVGDLVDTMETVDNDVGTSQSVTEKPTLMFKITSKRYKTVDGLLQRMFEADLDPEDFAEDEDFDPNNQSNTIHIR